MVFCLISVYYLLALYRSEAHLITKGSGCKGSNAFMRLSYHDPTTQAIPDAMHTIKDAVVNLYDLITGRDDTLKCRQSELKYGRHFGITEAKVTEKISCKEPGVPYSLSTEDIKLADSRQKILSHCCMLVTYLEDFLSKQQI